MTAILEAERKRTETGYKYGAMFGKRGVPMHEVIDFLQSHLKPEGRASEQFMKGMAFLAGYIQVGYIEAATPAERLDELIAILKKYDKSQRKANGAKTRRG